MPYECVLKCGKMCKSSDIISQAKWESLELKTKNWSGLDKFGNVYDTTSWKNGPNNHYVHLSCYISILSSDKLEKAQQRKSKEHDIYQCSLPSSSEIKAQNLRCDDETGTIGSQALAFICRWTSPQ